MANGARDAQYSMESRMREAAAGDGSACYDLGMLFSTGAAGVAIDLIAAHKWFNVATMTARDKVKLKASAQQCRSEIAGDMTAREIAEAQRQARAWLSTGSRLAA